MWLIAEKKIRRTLKVTASRVAFDIPCVAHAAQRALNFSAPSDEHPAANNGLSTNGRLPPCPEQSISIGLLMRSVRVTFFSLPLVEAMTRLASCCV